ncbi:uncharacterized protein METZ01_LOCUS225523, partial [marine metagenome]
DGQGYPFGSRLGHRGTLIVAVSADSVWVGSCRRVGQPGRT